MITTTKISKSNVVVKSLGFGVKTGLEYGIPRDENEQTIDCNKCNKTIVFFTDDLDWVTDPNDEKFEATDADCPLCGEQIEIVAVKAGKGFSYDFFLV